MKSNILIAVVSLFFLSLIGGSIVKAEGPVEKPHPGIKVSQNAETCTITWKWIFDPNFNYSVDGKVVDTFVAPNAGTKTYTATDGSQVRLDAYQNKKNGKGKYIGGNWTIVHNNCPKVPPAPKDAGGANGQQMTVAYNPNAMPQDDVEASVASCDFTGLPANTPYTLYSVDMQGNKSLIGNFTTDGNGKAGTTSEYGQQTGYTIEINGQQVTHVIASNGKCVNLTPEAKHANQASSLCSNHVDHTSDVVTNKVAHKVYLGCDPDITVKYNGVVIPERSIKDFPGGWWDFGQPPAGTTVTIEVTFQDNTPVVTKTVKY